MGLIGLFKRIFRRPPRLGIAFGSGGAKGMAHLGALRAFEEEGISFSVIAGTSIGSIVGALYAKGYSSRDMVQVIENLNRKEFSRNLRPFADLSFAEQFLSGYLEGDFSALKLPFGAWATDAATNKGEKLTEGLLARALTASSAIPPFFRAVEIGDKRYFDGAFTNAIPADLCKELGAEFVVGIDLSAFTRQEEEKSAFARFFEAAKQKFSPVFSRITPVKYTEDCKSRGYGSADFMLAPDLSLFRATDISREGMNRMYELGYEEAKRRMPELKEALKRFKRKR